MENTPENIYKEYGKLLEEKLNQANEALKESNQNTARALEKLAEVETEIKQLREQLNNQSGA